jgi:hypothetical protein
MRALARAAVLAAVIVLALPAAAVAYIIAPGTPVRDAGTYNVLPATGTCTIQGVTTPITSLVLNLVSPVSNRFTADPAGLRYWYQLTAVCGDDYVLAELSVPFIYSASSINNTTGTLTVPGIVVPASFTGESVDGWVATATITSGAGTVGSIVYGADNSAETSGVVSRRKAIDKAKTAAEKALQLTNLRVYLS